MTIVIETNKLEFQGWSPTTGNFEIIFMPRII